MSTWRTTFLHIALSRCRDSRSCSKESDDEPCVVLCRTGVEMDCWLVQKLLRDAHLLLARRPPSCNLAALLFTDTTGGCSGGVWDRSLLYVTERPATKAPVTALILTGSSLHGGSQCSEPSNTARTATCVAWWCTTLRANLALYG